MTFWIDAHLEPTLAAWLGSRFGIVAKALREIGLWEASDVELFEAGRRFGDVVIITKDDDLGELVTRRGKPPQILLLQIPNCPTIALQIVLSKSSPDAVRLLESGEALVEISTDNP